MHCGNPQHKAESCPKRISPVRPPTPRSQDKSEKSRVNFRVSKMQGEPLTLGREGDDLEDPEVLVDAYLASISKGASDPEYLDSSSDPEEEWEDEEEEDEEFEEEDF